MNNAIYAAATGSRIEMYRLDVISNNLANSGTAGYKEDKTYFNDILQYMSDKQFDRHRRNANVLDSIHSVTNFTSGVIKNTDNPLDFAIQGDGLFVVQSGDQEFYTRNGAFRVDSEGRLATQDGRTVMGESGEIMVGAGEVDVDSEGNILVDGQMTDRFKIVSFEDPHQLRKTNANLFEADRRAIPNEEPEFKIVGRALEMSNVNPVRQMAQLVETGRNYEGYQKVIKIINDINQRSSTQLGRV